MYMYVDIFTFTYTYVYIYTYIYIYTHALGNICTHIIRIHSGDGFPTSAVGSKANFERRYSQTDVVDDAQTFQHPASLVAMAAGVFVYPLVISHMASWKIPYEWRFI